MTIDQIISKHKQELFGYVLKHVKDNQTAQDIHQEILIKIFKHYKSINKPSSLKAWVYKIARNHIMDHFRKKNYVTISLNEQLAEKNEFTNDAGQILPCLRPFINQLKPNYRQALELIDLGGMSQKDFSVKMNMSYSGAKSTVQRARKQLKKSLNKCCQIEADKYGTILSVRPHLHNACS